MAVAAQIAQFPEHLRFGPRASRRAEGLIDWRAVAAGIRIHY
jgi:hypothetical protein